MEQGKYPAPNSILRMEIIKMIDKIKIAEYMLNNLNSGLLEGDRFIIVNSWDDIKYLNTLQNVNSEYGDNRICESCLKSPHNCQCRYKHFIQIKNTLDFEGLLGYPDYTGFYPVMEQDITYILNQLDLFSMTQNQMILDGFRVSGKDIIRRLKEKYQIKSMSWIKKWILDKYLNEYHQNLDDLNYWLKDDIESNYSIEYGFNDEYYNCDNCYTTIFRISPDSYNWSPEYLNLDDFGFLCKDCAMENLEDYIIEIQNSIKSGIPKSLPDIFFNELNTESEWSRVLNPLDTYSGEFNSGMYESSGKDNPKKQGKLIKSIGDNNLSMLDCIFVVSNSQFEVDWSIYIRYNPEWLEYQLEQGKQYNYESLEQVSKSIGDMLTDTCQDKYSYGYLCSIALQNISTNKPFNTILIDTDSGDIQHLGYDNLDDYLQSTK
jgi:hypothetical protein